MRSVASQGLICVLVVLPVLVCAQQSDPKRIQVYPPADSERVDPAAREVAPNETEAVDGFVRKVEGAVQAARNKLNSLFQTGSTPQAGATAPGSSAVTVEHEVPPRESTRGGSTVANSPTSPQRDPHDPNADITPSDTTKRIVYETERRKYLGAVDHLKDVQGRCSQPMLEEREACASSPGYQKDLQQARANAEVQRAEFESMRKYLGSEITSWEGAAEDEKFQQFVSDRDAFDEKANLKPGEETLGRPLPESTSTDVYPAGQGNAAATVEGQGQGGGSTQETAVNNDQTVASPGAGATQLEQESPVADAIQNEPSADVAQELGSAPDDPAEANPEGDLAGQPDESGAPTPEALGQDDGQPTIEEDAPQPADSEPMEHVADGAVEEETRVGHSQEQAGPPSEDPLESLLNEEEKYDNHPLATTVQEEPRPAGDVLDDLLEEEEPVQEDPMMSLLHEEEELERLENEARAQRQAAEAEAQRRAVLESQRQAALEAQMQAEREAALEAQRQAEYEAELEAESADAAAAAVMMMNAISSGMESRREVQPVSPAPTQSMDYCDYTIALNTACDD